MGIMTKISLSSGVALCAVVLATQAYAASATQNDSAADALAEIVVTASKQSERLRDVPASVTALGADQLQNQSLSYFSDYVAKVPGLNFIQTSPQYSQLILRGVSTGTAAPNASVATYVDEAPYGFSSPTGVGALMSPNLDAFDMARIEVLRGPQGTLYGSNAIGGLLKYVTKAPVLSDYSGEVQVGTVAIDGHFGWDVHGAFNVPLGTGAALRVTGYRVERPGYIDNPVLDMRNTNDFKSEGLRGSLLVEAAPNLKLRFLALVQKSETGDQGSTDVDSVTLKPVQGDFSHARVVAAPGENRNQLYSGTVDWTLGFASLVSATSYAVTSTDLQFDVSGTYTPYLAAYFSAPYGAANIGRIRNNKFTQELRLTSPKDRTFSWQLGGFYTFENLSTVMALEPVTPGTHVISPGLLGPLANSAEDGTYREFAGFGDIGVKFTPTFDVNVGVRYSNIHAKYHQFTEGAFLGSNNFVRKSTQNVFTYSAAARWRASEETMFYARAARGYQPGGPNRVAPFVGVAPSYKPSTTTNFEVGVKSRLLDGRLNLEANAFHVDWQDIQLAAVVAGNYSYTNGGAARSSGVEWNVDYIPVSGLTLSLNGAYTDAELRDDAPAGMNAFAGDPLPYIPKWSASAGVDYDWAISSALQGFVGASWRYTGNRKSDFAEDIRLPSFSVFDLRAGIKDDAWTLSAFAKNVGDARVINSIMPVSYSVPGGPLEAIIGPPTSFGATFSINF